MKSLRAVIAASLNTFHKSRVGVPMMEGSPVYEDIINFVCSTNNGLIDFLETNGVFVENVTAGR